ncbi:MAG: hypothetical protein HY079_01935, partial [Elusimicrobia bacterium]|nr:hypothetical protein [Elusimicrobiota bacterium]
LAAAVLLALGGGAWWLFAGRGGTDIDSGGFDLSAAPKSAPSAAPAAATAAPPRPASGLEMLTVDARTKAELTGTAPAAKPGTPSAPPPAARPAPRDAAEARARFTEAARRHEASVRDFALRMTAKSPVIARYGRDWMSYPDLKKLNDDYMRDHDPIAFVTGLTRAPNFPVLLKKYAGSPELASVVVLGVTQEAPADLAQAGLDLMRLDPAVKDPVTKVSAALGLPPDMAAKMTGGAPPPAPAR